MMTPEHVTNGQIEAFQQGALDPADLLEVTEHLANCPDCQDRAWALSPRDESVAHLQRVLERHLTDEELIGCVDGRHPAKSAKDDFVRNHLDRCAACREEVRDLYAMRSKVRRLPVYKRWEAWTGTGIAAVAVLAIVIWMRPAPSPVAHAPAAVPAQASAAPAVAGTLPSEYQELLRQALASGKVERAPVLDRLLRSDVQLLGPGSGQSFHVISPLGIVTAADKPVFKWQSVPGADAYVVSVYDSTFRKVAESPKQKATEWRPDAPLERGGRFSWEVVASIGDKEERFPVPPAREAVFEVMTAESVNEITRVRNLPSSSPLLLGLVYARAGALEDAEFELRRALTTEPNSEVIRRLLDFIQQLHATQAGNQNPSPTTTNPAQ